MSVSATEARSVFGDPNLVHLGEDLYDLMDPIPINQMEILQLDDFLLMEQFLGLLIAP